MHDGSVDALDRDSLREEGEFRLTSPMPKYYQVKERIARQIAQEIWMPGMLIPSEAELGQEFQVSRITIRRAISDLIHEGKLYTIQGKGTFVARPKLPERFVHRAFGIYEDLRRQGVSLHTQIVRQQLIPATPEIASRLGLSAGEEVMDLVRVRSVEDEKLLVSTTHIPRALCPDLHTIDLSSTSLYHVLQTRYGLKIARGVRSLEAVAAGQWEARQLDIALGSPLLLLDSIAYLADGRAFEYSRTFHRGDRARVEVEFTPSQDEW
ncbi:GntR family transcriptional regulator [Ktedonosporobacter rubrisoli]|uniref:GntR family transcriptional regulator n=1 Tax=Ktedonosporobacter rubrisoli TaxID=2509675 RepID=A0A4P6K4I6_KTERU|nr:GntR family transcriptional regulator [Ktedonosporobacter rubrisoli]QBD82965.1 GntR family transcriptional regulator [Ktedonosporobacter rubrisoli]